MAKIIGPLSPIQVMLAILNISEFSKYFAGIEEFFGH